MRKVTGKTYGEQRLRVDDTTFDNCIFDKTTLVFGGGSMPIFKGGEFRGVGLDFEGPALETIKFLRLLVLMGGRDLVRAQFELSKRGVQ